VITTTLSNSKSESPVYSPANTMQDHQRSDADRYLIEQIECGCQNAMRKSGIDDNLLKFSSSQL